MTDGKLYTDDELIRVECPNCGYSEEVSITPTFRIGFTLDVSVSSVDCSECGYSGEINND